MKIVYRMKKMTTQQHQLPYSHVRFAPRVYRFSYGIDQVARYAKVTYFNVPAPVYENVARLYVTVNDF